MIHTCQSEHERDTRAIGQRLGSRMTADQVVGLIGPLGSGKTQLAKGIADGLKVINTRAVNSPSYVIINEYDGRLHMYHIDVYRLGSAVELEDLGFDEMCRSGGVVVVEWADRVGALLPEDHLNVTLEPTGAERRRITFAAHGPQSTALLESIARSPV